MAPWERLDLVGASLAGPVAFGATLDADTVRSAYQHGLFPWPAASVEMAEALEILYAIDVGAGRIAMLPSDGHPYALSWWCPDPRALFDVDAVHLSNNLVGDLRHRLCWTTTADVAFDRVLDECRRGRPDSWITEGLASCYSRLHRLGWAHSVEVWDRDRLVGGTFGVASGRVFSTASTFHRASNASEVALADLACRFGSCGGSVIDLMVMREHVRAMGAVPLSRARFLEIVAQDHRAVRLPGEPLGAGRLAERER